MSEAGKHLSVEEIELLLAVQGDHQANHTQSDIFDGAGRHLAVCDKCRKLVSMHREWDALLGRVREKRVAETGLNCPPRVALFALAGGILTEKDAESLLAHVTECDHCGPILRDVSAVFSEEVSPEERLAIRELESAGPGWQRRLAKRLSAASETVAEIVVQAAPGNGKTIDDVPGKIIERATVRSTPAGHASVQSGWQGLFFLPRLVWSGALLAVLAIAAWFLVHALRPSDVNQMLAEAYTEKRVMAPRIPGAKYAPIRVERGAVGSTFEQPQALLDANALISRKLKARPDDPIWLEAKARADLLELHYDSAINTLQHALDLQPDSPPLMIDLASAYYQRAQANDDRAIDYGEAIEFLGRALAKTPDDPIALFNRAISEENLHLYEPAIADWQHYLRVDPSGPWAEEARARLDTVQKKLNSKQSTLAKPLLTPEGLDALTDGRRLADELNNRVEDYLHDAIEKWLPLAFTKTASVRKSDEAHAALVALAAVTRERHSDWWLTDLLSASDGSKFPSAVGALAAATTSNESGDYANGRRLAYEARIQFRSTGNLPGELRAETEQVYSDHLLYDGRECTILVRELTERLQPFKYEWLQAQASLEAANCADLNGDLGAARAAIERGTSQARESHYTGLLLRGIGFEADSAAYVGRAQEGFSLASRGLDLFWSNQVDLMKGYNLYAGLDTAADNMRWPRLQVALWQQATCLIDLHPDLVQRAMAHRWYGNAAYLANMPDVASREFANASKLFSEAPQTEATARGQMDAEIWLAGLEARKGELDAADARLRRVRDDLDRTPSFAPEIGYYTTYADLNLRRNDTRATETAIRAAIYLAEWALRSFPSQTDRRRWAKQTDPAYRDLVWLKLREGDYRSALELWEWYKGADFRSAKIEASSRARELDSAAPPDARNASPVRIPTLVAEQLPFLKKETVITYAFFPDRVAVWIYDDRGIFFRWIAKSPEELDALAIQFQHLCSRRDSNLAVLRAAARSLYDSLLAPIKDRIETGRTLAFELDSELSSIPLEALVDRDGHYLVEDTRVVVSPGVYQALQVHPRIVITAESRAVIVSVPVIADQTLPPLADADEEAGAVAETFRSPHWLRGSAATLGAVRHELHGAVVFHFAGHALALPDMNGLLLAERDAQTQLPRLVDAGSFNPNVIARLQLAVLSACDTWTVADARTSGNEGLTQTLLRTGVPYVVASRWSVDSVETAILMRHFYAQLIAGDDVSTSLRSAQLKSASQPGSAHPYYWASFGVQGS